MTFNIQFQGGDELLRKLQAISAEIDPMMQAAATEALKLEVLATEGLKNYPPETAANQPGRTKTVTLGGKQVTFRMGYYKRGQGYYTPTRGGGYKFTAGSERYGTQWHVTKLRGGAKAANRASYAPDLGGQQQVHWAKGYGWRRISDVVQEKSQRILEIFGIWLVKLLGLK